MSNSSTAPEIFEFLDYRQFLKAQVSYLKTQPREKGKFNLRSFAQKAGLKSPGFLKMVIEGKRQITPETARGFCDALHIEERERKYFLTLVNYNQEINPDRKLTLLNELMKLRPRSAEYLIEKKMNRYFSQPYYVCVREMVALSDFVEDPKWIAGRCSPKIRPSQATEAIATLLNLGLLRRNEQGKLEQTDDFIRTKDNINEGLETYHYHESILDKTRHALGHLPQNERNYYALTLPLPKRLYDEFISDYYEFRDRMIKKLNERLPDEKLDEVYQINFQIFPITRRNK